jgi:16S rRNA U1498 N3-methylase RsmE
MAELKFDRGTALSIFKSDRMEDIIALLVSIGIAVILLITVPIK